MLEPSSEIALMGKLRVATIGVPVLSSVAEPVGRFIAETLGVSFELVVYPNVNAYTQSFGKGEWEIAIGPRDLAPEDKSDLTSDLLLSDLIYVAAPGHEFADAGQIDRSGVKVGVVETSPSDKHLSRTLKSAELVRLPLSVRIAIDGIEMLRSGKVDVFGADSGIVYAIADGLTGAKVLPEAFDTVRVAVVLPKGRSSATQTRLAEIVNEAKRTGVVQKAIERAGLRGVRVAPD